MGEFISSKDWSTTPLGDIEHWPQSLRTTISLCLASNFPMSLAWGAACTQIYNDGYWPICGAKHPDSMGQDFRKCWASAWPAIGEAFESARQGKTRFLENQRMFLDRNGFLEETFFTFSFSPIRDESGKIGGLFHPVTETTPTMLAERRTRTLRELAYRTTNATTVDEAARNGIAVLSECPFDLPFVFLYLLNDDATTLQMAGCADIDASRPGPVPLAEVDRFWPVHSILNSGKSQLVEQIPQAVREQIALCGPYPESPDRAFVLPVNRLGLSKLAGILVAGISPRLNFDEAYRNFLEMVAGQFSTAISAASAYEAERRRSEALAEIDRSKTVFFSNISHEFRTPLTLMLGPIEEMLSRTGETIGASRYEVSLIHRNGLRLLRLVNSLLEFSRIEAGRVQAAFEPVDLAVLTAELASNFQSATEKAGLQLTIDCGPLREKIYVDRSMWEKIVLNLISNAFKFTLAGEIRVGLTDCGDRAELSVKDTGIGISKDDLPHLFDRFYRVQNALGRTYEGTGIGLSLVQELTRLHGGQVRVSSEPGVGTTFFVAVPFGFAHLPALQTIHSTDSSSYSMLGRSLVEESLQWLPVAEENTEGALISGGVQRSVGRILLADDNADMREYIRRILEADFEVEAVGNGIAAFESAQACRPLLVLSDVMMPKLDGFGLLSALRDDPRTQTVPVVLLSARAGEEASVDAMSAGADDYLTKPFGARELLARVRKNVELSKLRHQLIHQEESKLAIQEMERQWNVFDTVLSTTPDHIYQIDKNGRFVYANRSLLELRQWKLEDLVGKTLFEAGFPPDVAGKAERLLHEVISSGRAHKQEAEIESAEGSTHSYEYTFTPIFGPDGSVISVAGTSHEITEQKRAARTLVESNRKMAVANAELKRINRDLEEFAYLASHDLREPLRTLSISTQLLIDEFIPDDPVAHEYASVIRQNVSRMLDLIEGVLQFSKASHPDGLARASSVDLSSALSEAEAIMQNRMQETGTILSQVSLPRVQGEHARMVQVFQNLLSNAIKYRKPDVAPVIQLSATIEADNCVVSVQDNGIGFEPKYADRIFGLFKRLHTSAYPGTGVGLAICKRIVEQYGGRMWAQGDPGVGATFYFSLPLLKTDERTELD